MKITIFFSSIFQTMRICGSSSEDSKGWIDDRINLSKSRGERNGGINSIALIKWF